MSVILQIILAILIFRLIIKGAQSIKKNYDVAEEKRKRIKYTNSLMDKFTSTESDIFTKKIRDPNINIDEAKMIYNERKQKQYVIEGLIKLDKKLLDDEITVEEYDLLRGFLESGFIDDVE